MNNLRSNSYGGRRAGAEWLLVTLTLVMVVQFYRWTERTSGAFGPPDEEWDYYNLLVRGWRQGHLHLSKEPTPAMLALADPYDPAQNHEVRFPDASFFGGHYYLYFSAVPAALLLWPYHAITGHELGTPTAVYIFCLLGFFAASVVWLVIRRRYFPDSAWWIGAAGIAMLGLGTHVLVLARRPVVWELPIASAYAFAMLALLALYGALHTRRAGLAMAAAGVCLGLAIASRPTQLFAALTVVPVVLHLRRHPEITQRWRGCAVAAFAGLAVCGAAVAIHNYERFGNPLEFGMRYQLTSNYESRERHFGLDYVAPNVRAYFLQPVELTKRFPFVATTAIRSGPAGYQVAWVEPMAGLAVAFPFLWLILGLPWINRGRTDGGAGGLRAMVAATAVMAAGSAAFFLCFYCATTRYAVEFAVPLALLALMGWLGLERRVQSTGPEKASRWKRITVTAVGMAACGVTALAGVGLSFDYHHQALRTLSPQEWSKWEQFSNRLIGHPADYK